MKKLIILGGNSEASRLWAAQAGGAFGSEVGEVYVQHYEHWDTGENLIDFPAENEKLRDVTAVDPLGTDYIIFAKSYGTLLAFMAVHQGVIEPVKCVFFGIPFGSAKKHDLFSGDWSVISEFSVPTLAFHYETDPIADHDTTKQTLEELGVTSIELVSLPGDSHAYDAFDDYRDRITAFLAA